MYFAKSEGKISSLYENSNYISISIMGFLALNIRSQRKIRALTQEELANKIGLTRSIIGAYEEGRAEPKLSTLQNLAYFFDITVDALLNSDLSKAEGESSSETDAKGVSLRILPVITNQENKEFITIVPKKAAAGYLTGYSDPEFLEELPQFGLPLAELSQNRTYRLFQIMGDSMNPIVSDSYVICEYIQNWLEVKDNKCYVVLTKDDGIVYKRLLNKIDERNEFILRSDNPEYQPYSLHLDSILEIWKAVGYLSFELPNSDDQSLDKLSSIVMELKRDMNKLKSAKK